MFRITRTQLARFESAAVSTFEEAMLARGAALAPRTAARLGREQMLVVVRSAIARAARHGLTLKGPVGLFVELTFLFGSGFDADVQLPWARACLQDVAAHGEMLAASSLHTASLAAQRQIHGPGDRHLDAARRRLAILVERLPPLRSGDLEAVVLEALRLVHPQKYAFVGEPALRALIAAGEAEAARLGRVGLPDVLLLVALMFVFGQRCTEDPLYPWIDGAGSRSSTSIAAPALEAQAIEATASTWLRQVLTLTELSP